MCFHDYLFVVRTLNSFKPDFISLWNDDGGGGDGCFSGDVWDTEDLFDEDDGLKKNWSHVIGLEPLLKLESAVLSNLAIEEGIGDGLTNGYDCDEFNGDWPDASDAVGDELGCVGEYIENEDFSIAGGFGNLGNLIDVAELGVETFEGLLGVDLLLIPDEDEFVFLLPLSWPGSKTNS